MLKQLITAGADLTISDNEGNKPLIAAIDTNNQLIINLLIQTGRPLITKMMTNPLTTFVVMPRP